MKIWYRLVTTLTIALALDGLTKLWAESILEPYQAVPIVGQVFRLTLGYNTGVAFGLFANGGSWPLLVTGIVILGLAIWLSNALRTGEVPARAGWPIGVLLGGGIGNFADRFFDGRVTDFLDVGLGAARWPTFNLADSFITLSLVYLMFVTFGGSHHAPEPGGPEPRGPDPEAPSDLLSMDE